MRQNEYLWSKGLKKGLIFKSSVDARLDLRTDGGFVWANGRAARIGRAIPMFSIGCLPVLEALMSLLLDIW